MKVVKEKCFGSKNSLERTTILVVLSLLIGLLAGMLSHDHLARFNSGHSAWKGWTLH